MSTRTRTPPLRSLLAAVGLALLALAVYLVAPGGEAGPAGAASPAPSVGPPASSAPGSARLPVVALGALPAEAQRTVALIERGGPFPYARDGVAFGNRERLLPPQPAGYYREYTVPTPGSQDRGARRIVTGGSEPVYYYTDDHYASFARVRR